MASLARSLGFTPVDVWPLVAPHAAALNVVHWPAAAHEAVGSPVAEARTATLRGEAPTVGFPPAAAAALGR